MSRFALTYTTIKIIIGHTRRHDEVFVIRGPENGLYKGYYWLYNLIIGVRPNITRQRQPDDTVLQTRYGYLRDKVSYELVDTQTELYISFKGIQDTKENNRIIEINHFGDNNRNRRREGNTSKKNYDNYKDLFNEIIRIVSLINEKEENKNNKISLVINRSAIENYTEDKIKWKTPSNLGQFKPTFFTKIGFNDDLEWIPNKNINISDVSPYIIQKTIGQKLVNTATNVKKKIDTDAVNKIMGFLGNTNSSHFSKGGKRKTRKNKSKKSKKRNYSNKNH